jgi:hypothetical protein
MNVPPYSDALQRSDLKRYPLEIESIPNRGTAAVPPAQRESSFSAIAAEVQAEQSTPPKAPSQTLSLKPAKPFALWQDGDFGFGDFLDIINPLQHIPIVATIYRNMTGDTIGAAPRIIGGALWGRLSGFISGVVNVLVDWFTGKDVGDHIYTALFGNKTETANQTVVAQKPNTTAVTQVAAPAAQETVLAPPPKSPDSVLETDHLQEHQRSSTNKDVPPLSAITPGVVPDVMGQALLSSYLRGRRDEDSDTDSPRLRVKV